MSSNTATSSNRQVFATRGAFIFAAIGSAVGLGNIWRFPYIAYENGGGAFLIPYLVALLTAGIPILFMDYAIGHRYRGSSPLSFAAMNRKTETIGWVHVLISFFIAIYYAAIIAWALSYTVFSFTRAWGDDPENFLGKQYLQTAPANSFSFAPVSGVMIPLVIVWVLTLGILLGGVQKGIARYSKIFIPLLIILFLGLVVRALTLPGAFEGLDAFFSPDFGALRKPGVWVAAYGQIFFSLSVAYGIMITYASYLRRKTNMTGSGLVVGFSNSGFEILAGIGVFAALGFMANAAGVPMEEVVDGGIGLAFVAFPTLINQMPGGEIFGILFFLSLVFAGLSSIISLVQVVTSAVADKLGISERLGTIVIGGLMAVISIVVYGSVSGLNVLDVVDNYINNIGIVGIAVVALIVVGWVLLKLPVLRDHLNAVSSFKVGVIWMIFLAGITPVVLGYMFISAFIDMVKNGYDKYPAEFLAVFGWGVIAVVVIGAVLLAVLPWPKGRIEEARAHAQEFDAEHGILRAKSKGGRP